MSAKLRERANKLDEMIYSISLLSSEAEEAEIRIKSAMLKKIKNCISEDKKEKELRKEKIASLESEITNKVNILTPLSKAVSMTNFEAHEYEYIQKMIENCKKLIDKAEKHKLKRDSTKQSMTAKVQELKIKCKQQEEEIYQFTEDLKLNISPQSLNAKGSESLIDALKLDFTHINDRNPKKVHSIIISILDPSVTDDKFKLLAAEPHVDFCIEAHSALKDGDLVKFEELARIDYKKLYMH